MPTDAPRNIPVPDELDAVRAEIKALRQREGELRRMLIDNPDLREGAGWLAEIKTVTTQRVDLLELRACNPDLVVEFTFPEQSTRVELSAIMEDGEIIPARRARAQAATESQQDMNAVTTTEPVSAQTLEHVLGTGDLSKLSTQQHVEYYAKTCQSLGLNPLTRPMRFLSLNGQIQLYFTRDGTDQLRKAQGITLHIVDKLIDSGLFTVTVRARAKDGREDEDIGAVVLPQSGESRANALMKAMTKAKRRVTLSICGLGQTDESELDTMPGAQVFDAEDDLPVAPIRAAAAPMPRGARVAERAPAYEAPPKPHPQMPNSAVDPNPVDAFKPERTDAQWRVWLDKLRAATEVLYRKEEVVELGNRASVGDAIASGPPWVRTEVSAILAENYARFPEPEGEELPEVEIAGADKMAAG